MFPDDGLFPASDAMLDPRPLTPGQRVALLDKTYNEVLARNGGTYWLSAGPETDMLWDATLRTFVDGVWAATIVCAHAVCERTLASLMVEWYAIRPEPKNWRRWSLGSLVDHFRAEQLVAPDILNQLQLVMKARVPFNHWRDPMDSDSLSRVGLDEYARGRHRGDAEERYAAQLAYLCARTAVRTYFGDLMREVARRAR